MCPLFWGRDSYSGFKEKKIQLVSWGAFCIDQNVLLKTVGSDTVLKLCVDKRPNNSIPRGGPKQN